MATARSTAYHVSDKSMDEEKKWIEATKKDAAAFEPLYNRYFKSIFGYIYKRVEREDDAADLTSQVFIKAIKKIAQYEHRGLPFSAWLFRIAYTIVNDHYRKQKKRTINVSTDEVLDWLADDQTEENQANKEERIKWMLQAIKALKKEELELVEMRFFEARSFREIADILGIQENNAKVRCFRITERLKKEWTQNKDHA